MRFTRPGELMTTFALKSANLACFSAVESIDFVSFNALVLGLVVQAKIRLNLSKLLNVWDTFNMKRQIDYLTGSFFEGLRTVLNYDLKVQNLPAGKIQCLVQLYFKL